MVDNYDLVNNCKRKLVSYCNHLDESGYQVNIFLISP